MVQGREIELSYLRRDRVVRAGASSLAATFLAGAALGAAFFVLTAVLAGVALGLGAGSAAGFLAGGRPRRLGVGSSSSSELSEEASDEGSAESIGMGDVEAEDSRSLATSRCTRTFFRPFVSSFRFFSSSRNCTHVKAL